MPALPSSAPHCPALAPIIPHPHTMVRVGDGGLAWGSTPRKGHGRAATMRYEYTNNTHQSLNPSLTPASPPLAPIHTLLP